MFEPRCGPFSIRPLIAGAELLVESKKGIEVSLRCPSNVHLRRCLDFAGGLDRFRGGLR